MKYPNKSVLIALILFLAPAVLSQQAIPARVVEVIDGKTLVLEMRAGKVNAVLQQIDVPEPEQPLHQIVIEHLKQLVLGKVGDFRTVEFTGTGTVGQLVIGGVDVSQQMLRDGAAWLSPAEISGNAPERASYNVSETQAKADKLGVWSVKDLKPAWQVRADKVAAQRQEQERTWQQQQQQSTTNVRLVTPLTQNTGRKTGGINSVGGLISRYDAATRTGRVELPVLGMNDLQGLGRKVACSLMYIYQEDDHQKRKGTYYFYVAFVDMHRFGDNLSVVVDGRTIAAAKGRLKKEDKGGSTVEALAFEMSRSTVEKIANGNEVALRIGNEAITPSPGFQTVIFNLLDVTK